MWFLINNEFCVVSSSFKLFVEIRKITLGTLPLSIAFVLAFLLAYLAQHPAKEKVVLCVIIDQNQGLGVRIQLPVCRLLEKPAIRVKATLE